MKKEVKEVNPFKEFSLLQGKFTEPDNTNTENDLEDEVESGDPDLIDDDKNAEAAATEAERMAKGDAELAKTIAKQEKAAAKKKAELEHTKEDESEDDDSSEGEDNKNENSAIRSFVQGLSEKGIIDFDDTDESFTEDDKGIESLVDKTVSNRIDKWAKELPEDFSKLLDFVENGGTPKQFLDVYYGNHSWIDFKIDSEDAQKLAVKESLRLSGESAEDIEEIVTEWSDNGTLEKRAKSAIVKLQKIEKEQKDELVEVQKKYAAKQKADQDAYWDTFKKDLYSKEDIKGFKVTQKDKDGLWAFMTQVDKRTGKTQYQLATENDKDASLLFAYQAMKGFNIGKLEKQVESKVASKYAGMLKNYSKSSKEKISSGNTDTDFSTNPFAGFKQS